MTWDDTFREFRRLAAREGVVRMAKRVPMHPVTLYRLIGAKTHKPTQAVRAGIERIVDDSKTKEPKP